MLKEKLKEALKKAGLSEELAETINITDESQIEGVVIGLQATQQSTQFNFEEVLGSEEFSAFIEEKGFDGVLKLSKKLQSQHDKKVTDGIKTFQSKYFKKINGEEPGDNQDPDDTKMPAWAKQLSDKVDGIVQSKTTESKLEQAKALLTKSKLPKTLQEKWVGRLDVDSETSIEDQIKGLETEADDLMKEFGPATQRRGLPMGGNNSEGGVDDSVVEDLVENNF